MNLSKTFEPKTNSYSFFFRLVDLSLLLCTLVLAASFFQVDFSYQYLNAALIVSLVFLYIAEGMGLYRSWRVGRFSHMLYVLWGAITLAFISVLALAILFEPLDTLPITTFIIWFILALLCSFSWRYFGRLYKNSQNVIKRKVKKTLIIGATDAGSHLHQQIKEHNELGYDFLGFFDDCNREHHPKNDQPRLSGTIADAINLARNGDIDSLFIALSGESDQRMREILGQLGDSTVNVYFVPKFMTFNLIPTRVEHVGDMDILSVFESPYLGFKRWLKRAEDIIVSSIILALIMLPLLFIAVTIKLTSKGPVLFKQLRYGLQGQAILVWKFRSMTVMENNNMVFQATKNDSRVTPFGAFLRRTSLDELPQFFNVLIGDMSIVGPRPHAVAHNEQYRSQIEFYMLRHKVKPGITGWAQINGWRGETDTLNKMEKRIEFDLHYIKYWSIWFDIKIIFLTIFKGFTGTNAY